MAANDPAEGLVGDDGRGVSRPRWPRPWQLARAALMLARAWRRLRHVPTVAQLRTLAAANGWEPSSYLLDRRVNYLPEPEEMLDGLALQLGRRALCF